MRRTPLLILVSIALTACDGGRFGLSSNPSGGSPRHHRIQEGETLYSIASREYGDPLEWLTIQQANPWVDPEDLLPGDVLVIPPRQGHGFNFNPNNVELEEGAAATSASPAPVTPVAAPTGPASGTQKLVGGFRNLFHNIGGGTLFGEPVEKLGVLVLAGFLAHGFVQGFLLWIIATISFVKDVSLKKALKAAFHTEIITLFTVLILGGVAILMIHIGTTAPGGNGGASVMSTVETYLEHPVGVVVAAFLTFALYMLLCLRFIPPAFGLKRAQSTAVIFLAVLIPHLLAFYTLGQRFDFIQS